MPTKDLDPQRISTQTIGVAVGQGWRTFRAMTGPNIAYAAVFAIIGALLLAGVGHAGISPMALPFAGGFMLVGPALLAGFFELARCHQAGGTPGLGDALGGILRAPRGLWLVAGLCAFLFLVWITDAAVLYSFVIGSEFLPYKFPWLLEWRQNVVTFEFWGSLMGSALAFMIFASSAFSVPLMFDRRAKLVAAIHASVRATFRNLPQCLLWGLLISLTTLVSIILLPGFVILFPVLAQASYAFYQQVFPPA